MIKASIVTRKLQECFVFFSIIKEMNLYLSFSRDLLLVVTLRDNCHELTNHGEHVRKDLGSVDSGDAICHIAICHFSANLLQGRVHYLVH